MKVIVLGRGRSRERERGGLAKRLQGTARTQSSVAERLTDRWNTLGRFTDIQEERERVRRLGRASIPHCCTTWLSGMETCREKGRAREREREREWYE